MTELPYIRVLKTTEVVDSILWRLLPAVVETGPDGRYWIPETRVVWDDKEPTHADKETTT